MFQMAKQERSAPRNGDWSIHPAQPDQAAARLAVAKWLYQSRAQRPWSDLEGVLGEPAWDILLDLYIAQENDQPISVSSSCLGARAPTTTALRYIRILCHHAIIERVPDVHDRRRSWLRLTPDGNAALAAYLDRMAQSLRTARAAPNQPFAAPQRGLGPEFW